MHPVILDADGRYLRDAEIDEVGVIAVLGPNLFGGYLDATHNRDAWIERPESTGAIQLWLNTGDLGRVDAEGYFWLFGRKKELIRAAAAEFRSTMEGMIAERLAQICQPVDGQEGPRSEQGPCGEAGPSGNIWSVQAYVEDAIHYRVVVVVAPKSQKTVAYKCAELMKEMSSNALTSDDRCAAMRRFQKDLRFDAQGTAHHMPKERTEAEEIANIRWFLGLGRPR
jgi:acyl-CoA synthetase (AMP-forming)/AMP-acid ligase II